MLVVGFAVASAVCCCFVVVGEGWRFRRELMTVSRHPCCHDYSGVAPLFFPVGNDRHRKGQPFGWRGEEGTSWSSHHKQQPLCPNSPQTCVVVHTNHAFC